MTDNENPYSSLMHINNKPPVIFISGKGSWLMDHQNKRYLDFVQGWAVNSLGHASSVISETLARQSSTLINCSPAFYNQPALDLADLIVKHSCFNKVFFANSGAEANEGAIKLARKWGQKNRDGAYEIITMQDSFHGRTLATMSASGKPQWRQLFEPKVSGFTNIPLNDLNAAAAAINEKTVAVMLEPIQGEAGVYPASKDFLQGLRALTSSKGILLIVDEVQTGMGRTGRLFAYQHAQIEPDVMTLGKGMGGGVPLSALVAKEHVCCFEPGDQGGTYNGNPLMTAVGYAVMTEILKPGFLERAALLGEYLKVSLESLCKKYRCGEVRGKGLLVALQLSEADAEDIVVQAFEKGLLLNAPRPNVLRFMPALTVNREEIDQMLSILESILEQAHPAQ